MSDRQGLTPQEKDIAAFAYLSALTGIPCDEEDTFQFGLAVGSKIEVLSAENTRLRTLIQRMEEVGDFVLENYECAKKWICAMLGTEYTQDEVVIRWQELKKEMEG